MDAPAPWTISSPPTQIKPFNARGLAHARGAKLKTPAQRAVSSQASPAASFPAIEKEAVKWKPAPVKPETRPWTDGKKMWEMVETIRAMLKSSNDGEISVSAYDTAWVARVPSIEFVNVPQFPGCLKWIKNNQLEDGSWGDKELFLTYDRVCGTLACAVALKTWKTGDKIVHKATEFIRNTMPRMEMEDSNHMPIGFEIVFPALIEEAKELQLDIDYDAPVLQKIKEERDAKLQRIPMEVIHTYPTTLLHSLEGLHRAVDWHKVIKFQSPDGSLLFSPASTACALMYTGDKKCLEYLTNLLKKFNNAVPNVYPVDLFEHLWMVDKLQRLGIARYFTKEIKAALDYVYKHWTKRGIAWARDSPVQDVDDTSMAFRLLRSHGYDVSADVFENFCEGEAFFCFAGQSGQAVTGMYNLYRASQTAFPGEHILQKAKSFTKKFLQDKRQKNQLYDKWIISKDLPGEVELALDYPVHATLERIEARRYLEQYAADDVWIGKSLYRMPYVNNDIFLALAKADFNTCQAMHRKEFQQLTRWYNESNLSTLLFSQEKLATTFFSAAATIFEPELGSARHIWSQSLFISSYISEYFTKHGSVQELKHFVYAVQRWDSTVLKDSSAEAKTLFLELQKLVQTHSKQGFLYQGRSISNELKGIWQKWISRLLEKTTCKPPTVEDCLKYSSTDVEPAVRSTVYFMGEKINNGVNDSMFCKTMNTVVNLMQDVQNYKDTPQYSSIHMFLEENPGKTEEYALSHIQGLAEEELQVLVYETIHSASLPDPCKKLFLNGVRVSNLFAHHDQLSKHVQTILFQPIV